MSAAFADLLDARMLLRLALVPTAVWLASVAARRWGHAMSGYLGGLPLIGGPITLYLALDYGNAFAARSAALTLATILAQAAHLLAFAHVGRRARWPAALAAGWSAFALVGLGMGLLAPAPAAALLFAIAGLFAAARWLPRFRSGSTAPPLIPRAELRLRLAAAFVLAALILWSAQAFGPIVSGVLLSMPVTGSIMPPFTLALYGPDAVARLTRGFVAGLSGFAAFFAVLAFGLVPLGTAAAFALAVLAALVGVSTVARIARSGREP